MDAGNEIGPGHWGNGARGAVRNHSPFSFQGLCGFSHLCFSLCLLVSIFQRRNLVCWQPLDQAFNPGATSCGFRVEVLVLSGAFWASPSRGHDWSRQTDQCVVMVGIKKIFAKKWANERVKTT